VTVVVFVNAKVACPKLAFVPLFAVVVPPGTIMVLVELTAVVSVAVPVDDPALIVIVPV
jgi:hypothetical protein